MLSFTGFLWICLMVGCDLLVKASELSCEGGGEEYEYHLGTKTPYRIVGNRNASEIKYPGCEAKKLWAMVRHGTRNPSAEIIEKMRERLPEVRDLILESKPERHLSPSDLDKLRTWTTKLKDKSEKKLAHEGEDEMILLAERLQMRFPQIFDKIYSNTSYLFKYTATQRTRKSAQYFTAGLFGRQTINSIEFPEPLAKDPILRFYKLCNKWRREVSKNPATLLEKHKFETSSIMTATIRQLNQRLNLHGDDALDLSDVHLIYMTCAFETAWKKQKRSPWCRLLTLDDFRVFEYYEDLKYYWKDGYGYDVTYRQACPAFLDALEHFQNNQRFPKVVAYFSHSGTLLKMLAHVNLHKDPKPLLAKDYYANGNRKWKVGKIDAFGSNLIFVLFDCQGNKKMLTLHQEQVVRLPACPDADLCDLDQILRHYGEELDDCDFDEICENQ